MILVRSEHPRFLSNSYLVADRPGGHACVVDTGADPAPLLAAIDEHDLTPELVLLTHHHHDHVEHNGLWGDAHGLPLCGHRNEVVLFGDLDRLLEHEETVAVGELRITSLLIPGHTLGQLAFDVVREGTDERLLFTGDTLFRESVGGTRGPGHTTHTDLRRSILERLLTLPHDTEVCPGHSVGTTLGHEWEHNPFVRYWRGLDAPLDRRVTAFGRPAVLEVEARDYDGGTKCLVRWDEPGTEGQQLDVVPGSKVKPA